MSDAVTLEQLAAAIRDSETDGLAHAPESGVLSGLSGEKVIGAMQRAATLFADDDNACYVEVGVFQGLTLLSIASAVPQLNCFGIDDFVHFDTTGRNFAMVKQRRETLGLGNAHVIDKDYEDAFAELDSHIGGKRIAVYFVDGGHDYRSQLMCLMLAMPYMHENGVIFVDDANYRHVRQANSDFLATHPDFALLFEGYSAGHPDTLTEQQLSQAYAGWWNGVNVIVRDTARRLPRVLPPTHRSRTLYENEHLVHRLALAELAPDAVRLAGTLAEGGDADAEIRKLGEAARGLRDRHPDRLLDKNTYSADLPASHLIWDDR